MDSAIAAALVTTPSALLAASAAYAAGLLQARGAHRGPVNAVRRQHQRDAYAAFLGAATTYAYETRLTRNQERALAELPTGNAEDVARIERRSWELRAEAAESIDPLQRTLPVVLLEGPEHIAERAQEASIAAHMLRSSAPQYVHPRTASDARAVQRAREEHARLVDAINAFTIAARDYLNGGG
ncbi:hypothetical protein ACFZAV_21735 [Streptomyces sp. NPDC008343]|uniref:hypothetical protein n=1 Tax=Streptomyces sp. NPDC008343 TaxID=3364828 RepID=UPI0036E1724B